MSRFIETIRIEEGTIPLLPEHQQRIGRTLAHLGMTHPFLLEDVLVIPQEARKGIIKCRVIYDKNGVIDIQFEPYIIKNIDTFSLVDIGSHTYTYKYENRDWIYDLLKGAAASEIIMCKEDYITDASYANLAFFNGTSWVTPRHPLLYGTRRQQLIRTNILSEVAITIKELHNYSHIKCINAMMTWEESPICTIGQIL